METSNKSQKKLLLEKKLENIANGSLLIDDAIQLIEKMRNDIKEMQNNIKKIENKSFDNNSVDMLDNNI